MEPRQDRDRTQHTHNPGREAFRASVHARDDAKGNAEPGANAQSDDVVAEAAGHGCQPRTTRDFLHQSWGNGAGTGQHRRIDEAQTRNGLPQPEKDEEADARKQEKAHKRSVALGGALIEAWLEQAFERQLLIERPQLDLISLHEARRLDDRARIDLELGRG